LKAGFAETDITPPVGTRKIGWLKDIVSDRVLDPLFARVAVFERGSEALAFIQLDTLCVRWTQAEDLRRRIHRRYGFPPQAVLVAATHNHAGPAVANVGDVRRDEAYIETLSAKCVKAFGRALDNRQPAEIGFGRRFEFDIAHNRRLVMRDGTVKTHGTFQDSQALYVEGPVDPEVAVLAARNARGEVLGCLVNFACHPVDHGGGPLLSAGYPGVLARLMKGRGCPVTLFLNGACGNLSMANPHHPDRSLSMEAAGQILADHAALALAGMPWQVPRRLASARMKVQLAYRRPTEAEIRGAVRGAQRFIDPAIYDRGMDALCERIRARGSAPAEVQALVIDDHAWIGIPAEYFVQHGLRIKEQAYPMTAHVVSHANGMLGYLPHREAFARGGYETTFAGSSRMAPEAGDQLADAALGLVRHFQPMAVRA